MLWRANQFAGTDYTLRTLVCFTKVRGCGSIFQGGGKKAADSSAITPESRSSRRQGLFGGRKRRTIGADSVATVALGPIEGRICQLHQFNRIAGVVRERSYTNANCNVVRLQFSGRSF